MKKPNLLTRLAIALGLKKPLVGPMPRGQVPPKDMPERSVTGRVTVSKPNLQTIPINSDEACRVREAFSPRPPPPPKPPPPPRAEKPKGPDNVRVPLMGRHYTLSDPPPAPPPDNTLVNLMVMHHLLTDPPPPPAPPPPAPSPDWGYSSYSSYSDSSSDSCSSSDSSSGD